VGLLLLVGCGWSYRIVRQTNPTPLRGARDFAVAPMVIGGATVDITRPMDAFFGHSDVMPVEQYVAQRRVVPFELLAGSMVSRLNRPPRRVGPIAGPPPAGVFVIQVRMLMYRPEILVPRSYGTGTRPAAAKFRVQISSANGVPLDEIEIMAMDAGVVIDELHPEAEVLDRVGENLGEQIARYLDARTR
jgi:hypothetical protein